MWLLTALGDAQASPPLEVLIARIASGDQQALRMLYAETHAAVFGYALSIVKHRCDAEDVMQETYMSLCAAAHQYRAMGKPMAWLLTIARNLALMKLRKLDREAVTEPVLFEAIAGFEPLIAHEDRLVLMATLKLLTDEERQVVNLHALSGLKHREIATLMGLPLSTVLSKYNRALKKLKRALREGGFV